MFGTWYITYFLIIFQMESEEGEEMEVARDVVVIPIRDKVCQVNDVHQF